MNFAVVVLITALSAVTGVAVSLFVCRARAALLQERKIALEQELATARAAGERQNSELLQLREARAALQATLDSERRNTEEKLHLLQDSGEQLKSQFKALASTALQDNNANFLQLANTVLQRQQ